jgi:protein TonB
MTSLLHSLHIGTLATWLSVAGFGTVAVIVPSRPRPSAARPESLETQWIAQDFTLGGESSPAIAQEPSSESIVPAPAEILPAPPEMPDLTGFDPLPEVPEPPPAPAPTASGKSTAAPRQSARADAGTRSSRPATGNPASSRSATSGQPGGGSGLSNSARLAAGSMPSPAYPAEARRLGQTGTLVVEFTVDSTGRVISAYAKSPSPWPLLNQEAVRTVRRWKFPPGPVMKLQRPIVFQLR